jgi:hypothetical protein
MGIPLLGFAAVGMLMPFGQGTNWLSIALLQGTGLWTVRGAGRRGSRGGSVKFQGTTDEEARGLLCSGE